MNIIQRAIWTWNSPRYEGYRILLGAVIAIPTFAAILIIQWQLIVFIITGHF